MTEQRSNVMLYHHFCTLSSAFQKKDVADTIGAPPICPSYSSFSAHLLLLTASTCNSQPEGFPWPQGWTLPHTNWIRCAKELTPRNNSWPMSQGGWQKNETSFFFPQAEWLWLMLYTIFPVAHGDNLHSNASHIGCLPFPCDPLLPYWWSLESSSK